MFRLRLLRIVSSNFLHKRLVPHTGPVAVTPNHRHRFCSFSTESEPHHEKINQRNSDPVATSQARNDLNSFTLRTHHIGQLSKNLLGAEVSLTGWVQHTRERGKHVAFLILRDAYGIVQVCIDLKKFPEVRNLHLESVVHVEGLVCERPKSQIRQETFNGDIEVQATNIKTLSGAIPQMPFPILNTYSYLTESKQGSTTRPCPSKVDEGPRKKFRHLDIRNEHLQWNLRLRSLVIHSIRRFLIEKYGFVDVETPALFRPTPGGAREFIVPSRFKNEYYSLPQSPQQHKQLLMMGAMDRYFQIAKCFRNENTKPDRQPEFTQLDLELSFTTQEGVLCLVEQLIAHIYWTVFRRVISIPFPRMTYEHAMKQYGSDKPDLRPEWQKFYGNDISNGTHSTCSRRDEQGEECEGKESDEDEKSRDAFLWVIDFPLFLPRKEEAESNQMLPTKGDRMTEWESTHHPFTAPIEEHKDLVYTAPDKVIGQHYDLVLNGREVGGGSIRIHDSHLQEYIIKQVLKLSDDADNSSSGSSMDYFLEALKMGCPPHGGIALGLDRLMAHFCGSNSIREVIAFPKSSEARCPMSGAPSPVSPKTLAHYHLNS